MKIKQLLALFCFSLFALSGFAQTKEAKTAEFEWEKIVPLVTKKAEVENYFGKPYKETFILVGMILTLEKSLFIMESNQNRCFTHVILHPTQ